jgi:hypothetical protein
MISIDTEWTFRGYPNLLLQDSGILQRASLRPERATGVVEAGRANRQLGAGCRQESQHNGRVAHGTLTQSNGVRPGLIDTWITAVEIVPAV